MTSPPVRQHQGDQTPVTAAERPTWAFAESTNEDATELLAAIIESSGDAIISKTMDGIVTSWNRGAEALFGYHASEAIGKPITMLIPDDRLEEEPRILARLQAGQKVDHFETVRRRKDGSLIDISLTISPIRDREGAIIGASKVARDISASKRMEERQFLMLREMHHRVKNLFALTSGLISMASRSAASPSELAASMRQRLGALAAAHELTMPSLNDDMGDRAQTTLLELVGKVVAPYQDADGEKISLLGSDVTVGQPQATHLALLFHELATNASKYGALSLPDGRVSILALHDDDHVRLEWRETAGPRVQQPSGSGGFGTRLIETIARDFPCSVEKQWNTKGFIAVIKIPFSSLAQDLGLQGRGSDQTDLAGASP
jgi:PAS domain S-box-containing protein